MPQQVAADRRTGVRARVVLVRVLGRPRSALGRVPRLSAYHIGAASWLAFAMTSCWLNVVALHKP